MTTSYFFGDLKEARRTLGYYLLECEATSTDIVENDPTFLCVIDIKDGKLDKWN